MKYFVYSFIGMIIILILVFLCVNFGSGGIDSNAHFHLDVLIRSANNAFEEVNANLEFGEVHITNALSWLIGPGLAKQVVGQNLVYQVYDFIYRALVSLLGLIKAIGAIITTPCIY